MLPLVMPSNRFEHFYRGGGAITALRGVPFPGERSPEEWLASATARFGEDVVGLSRIGDGRLLRDVIAADPAAWLGPGRAAEHGGDAGVLVKLLDAGERLPVHVHPDRSFARRHLDCRYGKTESWYVIGATEDAGVHLGFTTEVSADDLRGFVERQDVEAMLSRMHRIPVRVGDGVLVPAGMPHAIGAGVFVVETQEPTDFSILLEWKDFALDGPTDGHLGLGFDLALDAVDRSAWRRADVETLVRHVPPTTRSDLPARLLPDAADEFFRVNLVAPRSAVPVPAGFAVLVVLSGSGRVASKAGETTTITRGDVLAVPYATGPWQVTGAVSAVLCRPAASGPDPT